jgi:hypothetical protein
MHHFRASFVHILLNIILSCQLLLVDEQTEIFKDILLRIVMLDNAEDEQNTSRQTIKPSYLSAF